MTILNILTFPNKNLLKKAEKIKNVDAETIKTINNITETMFYYGGIGIAANQVDINKQIIIININNNKQQSLVVINPKIIYSNGQSIEKEGCLSFPNIFIKVKRKKKIKLVFTDIKNNKKIIKTDKLLSICLQHEIDHLYGITLYDKMSNLKKKIFIKKIS